MKVTAYVGHFDCSRHDTGWDHPEHQGRLPAVARAVYRDMLTLFDPLLEMEGDPAGAGDLALAHAPEYIDRVRALSEEAEQRDEVLELSGQARVSSASWAAGLAAVGCALTAVEAVLTGEVRNAFCAVRPPGAEAGVASPGRFGLFNSVAVAARHLRERRGVERLLVVEWGARPGRGTAEILGADAGVRIVSLHQELAGELPLPPPDDRWSRSLPAGSGGDSMLRALRETLDAATADFAPEFILLALGCDALAADPLGSLSLEPSDYHPLTLELRTRADARCAGRLVSVLEGGYAPAAMGQAVVQHLRALASLPAA